nr:hypothetical protein [Tanacetum cinerariifolium]
EIVSLRSILWDVVKLMKKRRLQDFKTSMSMSDKSSRVIASKGDLRGYWDEILSFGDFLTTVPSYIQIKDPLRRLCHRLIAHTIIGRGQAPEKVTRTDLYFLKSMDREAVNLTCLLVHYLFRHANGRKWGTQMSGGHFIARLADYFRLLTKETPQGATVVDWVSPGPERQQVATDGTLEDVEGAPIVDEVIQVVLTPVQAPQPPPSAVVRTMPQRITRLKEEVYGPQ